MNPFKPLSAKVIGKSTYIQKEGIHDDFEIIDIPDEFYGAYGTNLKGLKRILYQSLFRHIMNIEKNVMRAEYESDHKN